MDQGPLTRRSEMDRQDTVLLVHGLWLHALAMELIRARLRRAGYVVRSYSYPSVRVDLARNAERLGNYCRSLAGGKLHIVAHSMGGLVALKAAALVPPSCLGRIVLIGSPFGGSYSARALERWPGGRRILGHCIREWLEGGRLSRFDLCELGIIAGSRSFGLGRLVAPGLPRPNDGVVSVDETRVPGMRDHIVLHVGHTEMLVSRPVVAQICAFLEHGTFDRTQGRK